MNTQSNLLKKNFTSLHEFFLRSAQETHNLNSPFLHRKVNGLYTPINYRSALEKINAISIYLMSLGWEKGDKVAMILDNCPEYIYWDQAMLKLGLVNTAIYPTLSPEETEYILKDSGAKGVVVGTPFLLKKVQKIQQNCSCLEKIFPLFEGQSNGIDLISYGSIIKQGKTLNEMHKHAVEKRFKSVESKDLAALIYTSGTTGVPKGVMLSHYNFMSNAYDALELCPQIDQTDKFLSFLPLSHVYERLVSYYLCTYIGGQIAFSEGIEKIATNMAEAHPSVLATVPRLLERMEDKVRKNVEIKGGISKKIFYWAINLGRKIRKRKEIGKGKNLWQFITYPIAKKLVFDKIKEKLGGNIKLIVSGGGALPQHIGEFFGNIGIQVQEGYGLTETSPFVTVNEFHRQLYGTVGRVAPSQKVALESIENGEMIATQTYDSFDPNFQSEEGEILVKGPNVMLGYYNKPQETEEVFDKDGWFHTGDIGRFEQGYLKITDRKKNMLKTSLGKNIYPTPIENAYLKSDFIEQLFLLGDQREFVTAIIVPSETFLEKFKILSNEDNVLQWITSPDCIRLIEEELKTCGKNLAKYEKVKRFVIKATPFSIENGEMTPTQKIKRKVVVEKYKTIIEDIYK